MKIVVLDGYCLNPGDLSWADWKDLGDFELYDRTPKEKTVERAKDAEIAITNKTVFDRETIEALPKLKYIGVLATGYNVIDVEAAAERGIPVTNVPTYSTDSVAEHTIGLLLELCRHSGLHSWLVSEGEWSSSKDFSFWRTPQVELSGKTMGIIGLGRIGRRVGEIALAMNMKVLGNKNKQDNPLAGDFEWASKERIFSDADVVSLHCPQFPETEGMVNSDMLSMMKPSAFLLNTSRGGLIVDKDLANALNEEKIAGAALDVMTIEPPPEGNPLFDAKNCVITPHIAWTTYEARTRLMKVAVDNLGAFLNGNPVNVVNQPK